MQGQLLGNGQGSVALTNASTLSFDWDGNGIADLNIQFNTAPQSLIYNATTGAFIVG